MHTRLAGVIGQPVRHSLSPVIHNAAFRALGLDWAYLAFEVAPGSTDAAVAGVRALGIDGLSVTMPHKAAVASTVDRLSPAAEALGAVNTVVRRAGNVLVGENTDGLGFLDALRADEGFDPAARRCVVVGAGGAGRAVALALAQAGAAEVVVLNRTRSRAEEAVALAGPVAQVGEGPEVAEAELVVNATPLGMLLPTPRPVEEGEPEPALPVDPGMLGPGQLVVDLVYHPAITPLMQEARARGAVAVNGLGTLIHQAAHAFRLWTGDDPPVAVMSAAALAVLNR